MKNHRELLQALLDGKVVTNGNHEFCFLAGEDTISIISDSGLGNCSELDIATIKEWSISNEQGLELL